MSLHVTPAELSRRAEFYHQLDQLTAAGIGLPQALESLRRHPPGRSFRNPLSAVIDGLAQGRTFNEALQTVGRWMPSFDRALVHAGEKSGRLPACFKLLADHYRERARLTRQVMSDLAYPFFLFHFAILLGPIPALFTSGNLLAYLRQVLAVLLPIYGVVLLLIYAALGGHGESWRAMMEAIVRAIPLWGGARRNLALARVAAALEALINAGVPIIEAWEFAADASGSPALRRAVLNWKPRVLAGQTPAEALRQSPEFPEHFANLYHTGEITGQLDDTLLRLRAYYQEEGTRKLRALAEWTPKLIYLAIALMIAWRVVSFWAGYYGQLSDVLK
jgi:general secretion pathway protein F/type IV pilus assembly protein PilC